MRIPAGLCFGFFLVLTTPAAAGPPYVTDDPVPTGRGTWEIFAYDGGTRTAGGSAGAAGLDFNYGAADDLQLSMTLPVAYAHGHGAPLIGGFGNVEIGAKYRFLHQDSFGVDVAVFPRVILPSASHRLGEQHATYFLPLWIERDWDQWAAFGGGGCAINRGGGSKDFCLVSAALTRQVFDDLQFGVEVTHQTPEAIGEDAATSLGFGVRYDITTTLHFVGSAGPGLRHPGTNNQYSWYAALLFTF